MIDVRPYLLRLSIISILRFFLRLLRRAPCMALLIAQPPTSTPSSPPPPSIRWLRRSPPPKQEASSNSQKPDSFYKQETSRDDQQCKNMVSTTHGFARQGSDHRLISPMENPAKDKIKVPNKRPAQLIIPTSYDFLEHGVKIRKDCDAEKFEVIKGRDFFLAMKKGRRKVMEDRHAVSLDISGDPKQAFFVVIDGHGGDAAANYVAENLGKNIVNELEGSVEKAGQQAVEAALRGGYLATDKQFLAQQDVNGGACAAGVLLKNGELHVANVGDCKVVLSRKGKAIPLTNDHRLSREDERARIENSGGFLYCGQNGIWRVNGSLAVSRAFGDGHLKDWIISEPEIVKLPLTIDCQFLILASDGLWDKVSDQEAVDVVLSDNNLPESCRKLVDMSSSRGSHDDITVMMINLENFKINIT